MTTLTSTLPHSKQLWLGGLMTFLLLGVLIQPFQSVRREEAAASFRVQPGTKPAAENWMQRQAIIP